MFLMMPEITSRRRVSASWKNRGTGTGDHCQWLNIGFTARGLKPNYDLLTYHLLSPVSLFTIVTSTVSSFYTVPRSANPSQEISPFGRNTGMLT